MKSEIDAEKLRFVAGGFATGIAVASVIDEDAQAIGMTINSFVSVSLDPPLILFSVANDAHFLDHLEVGLPLSVNILSNSQKHISDHFAGFLTHDLNTPIFKEGRFVLIPNAVAWYKLKIEELIESGDHKLVICKVLDCHRDPDKDPILFYNGYRTIGEQSH